VLVDIAALQRENSALREQLDRALSTVSQLADEVAKLNDRVAELLVIAQRKQRKPVKPSDKPSEKKPAQSPVVTAEQQRAFEARPKPPTLPEKINAPKKAQRRTGRNPVPKHLEAEEHTLRPSTCDHCGSSALDVVEDVVEEKLHVVKEHQRRRVVRRTTCRCRTCFERTTPASLPAPYARSKVTCEWLAWFVHQKFALLAPLDRVRRDLAERDIPLAMGTLVGFVERAADLLAPIDGLHWKKLLTSPWMATDGTGIKVLVPGLAAAHDGYVELYRNAECAVVNDREDPEKFEQHEE